MAILVLYYSTDERGTLYLEMADLLINKYFSNRENITLVLYQISNLSNMAKNKSIKASEQSKKECFAIKFNNYLLNIYLIKKLKPVIN